MCVIAKPEINPERENEKSKGLHQTPAYTQKADLIQTVGVMILVKHVKQCTVVEVQAFCVYSTEILYKSVFLKELIS